MNCQLLLIKGDWLWHRPITGTVPVELTVPVEKAPSPGEAPARAFWSLEFASPWETRGLWHSSCPRGDVKQSAKLMILNSPKSTTQNHNKNKYWKLLRMERYVLKWQHFKWSVGKGRCPNFPFNLKNLGHFHILENTLKPSIHCEKDFRLNIFSHPWDQLPKLNLRSSKMENDNVVQAALKGWAGLAGE